MVSGMLVKVVLERNEGEKGREKQDEEGKESDEEEVLVETVRTSMLRSFEPRK